MCSSIFVFYFVCLIYEYAYWMNNSMIEGNKICAKSIWAVLLCDFACIWILKHSCLVYLNWYCFQFQFVIESKFSVFLVWLSIKVFNLFQSWVWTLHQIIGNHFVNIRLRNSSSWTFVWISFAYWITQCEKKINVVSPMSGMSALLSLV